MTLGGSPLYMVERSRFIPGTPENLQMNGNNSLEWDTVPCASKYQVTFSTEDGKTTTKVRDALSKTQLLFPSSPCQTVDAVVKAVSGSRNGPAARITFNTCKAEEDHDDDNASFLLADFQEEECPPTNFPLCKAPPTLPVPLPLPLPPTENLERLRPRDLERLSQYPTPLILLVAGGLLLLPILAIVLKIVIKIVIRKRQSDRSAWTVSFNKNQEEEETIKKPLKQEYVPEEESGEQEASSSTSIPAERQVSNSAFVPVNFFLSICQPFPSCFFVICFRISRHPAQKACHSLTKKTWKLKGFWS